MEQEKQALCGGLAPTLDAYLGPDETRRWELTTLTNGAYRLMLTSACQAPKTGVVTCYHGFDRRGNFHNHIDIIFDE